MSNNKFDFSTILFHPYNISGLLTPPKSKADKEAGKLGATAKTIARERYLQVRYGKYEMKDNKHFRRGRETEQDCITLISVLEKDLYVKNKEKFRNKFVSGIPDIYRPEPPAGREVKSCGSLRALDDRKVLGVPDKTHVDQCQCYLWLTGLDVWNLDYCLVDTPEEMINQELYYLALRTEGVMSVEDSNPDWQFQKQRLINSMTFSDIPREERIKSFKIERNEARIEQLKVGVLRARDYLRETYEQ